MCFIAVYAVQVAAPGLPAGIRSLITWGSWVIWGVFAADLVARVWLTDRRMRYLLNHLLRSTQAIATAAGVLVLIAALAALDAERDAEGAHITNLAESLWWAATTVTTVGYGDTYPITGPGRMVAVALMLVGISLVGVITATVAGWFISQTRSSAEAQDADLSERLSRMEAALAEILTGLHTNEDAGPTTAQAPSE